MSNDDDTTPNGPRDDSETGLGRLGQGPDEVADAAGEATSVFSTPPIGEPTPPGGGIPIDATEVMSTTPRLPSDIPPSHQPAAPLPPGAADTTTVPLTTRPPRQKQSGLAAGVILGLLLIGAIVAFIVLSRGDDDDAVVDDVDAAPVALIVTRVDANGSPLATTIAAEVTARASAPFTFTSPTGVVEGEPARVQTDANGRAEFGWLATGDDIGEFESTVVLREFVAGLPGGGDFVESVNGQCALTRDGERGELAIDTSLVADTENDSTTQAGEYRFPNATFAPGDRIECTLSDIGPATPPPTTVPPESTTVPPETTVVESTTTAPEATTTTTTLAPETTTTSTTTTTTTTTTTLPEPTGPTLGDFLGSQPDLSQSLELLEFSGLLDELADEVESYTLFVPDNAAIDELRAGDNPQFVDPDLEDPDVVRGIFLTHLQRGAVVTDLSTVRQIFVDNGGPQPVDATVDPITVGGVEVLREGNEVDTGVVHVLAGVLAPQ